MSEGFLDRDRATRVMNGHGIDVLVASTPQNVLYTTSYHSHGQWLMPASHALGIVPRDGTLPTVLIVSVGDLDGVADQQPDVGAVVPYGWFVVEAADDATLGPLEQRLVERRSLTAHGSLAEALAAALYDLGLSSGCIGLDRRGLLPQVQLLIDAQLGSAAIVDGYGPLQEVRMVKTAPEVDNLRSAVEITERAIQACLDAFRVGVTERELLRLYENVILDNGARPTFSHILFGARGALSNGFASDAPLRLGDTVRFDSGCMVGGYHADIARTAVFGDLADSRIHDYYQAILAGEEEALATMRPGITAGDAFETAMEATRRAGIPHYRRNHVGHGIGIELYDPPMIVENNPAPIEVGMVLNLETPYYELGWSGLQVEDTFVVTSDGYELLSTMERGLIRVAS